MSTVEVVQDAGSLSLRFLRGDTLSFQLNFGMTLVDYALSAYIIKQDNSHLDLEIIDVDRAAGKVQVVLSAVESATLTELTYSWVFKWVVPGGVVLTVLRGAVVVQ